MAERKSFTPPTHREMRENPSKQMVWYDTLPLPDSPTVESEVLPTIETNPLHPAYSHRLMPESPALRGMARTGIVLMEVLGPPRAMRPWRPRI